jgi:hypothetical protein
MFIFITPEEFNDGLGNSWKKGIIESPSIDYATNSLNGWIGKEEVILFNFKHYGFINDNRCNKYEISAGAAGITIRITKTLDP